MPVKENLENVGSVIKAVAAIIALFPGIAVLLGLVDIPPSLADLVKVISFSVSGIVLLAVFLMSDRIARLSREKVALCSIVAVLLGAACTVGYFRFANSHTVVVDVEQGDPEKYIIPLNPQPRILEAVAATSNDYKRLLQTAPNRAQLKQWMVEESGSSMIIMILLLVFSEILLVAPVVCAAWRLAGAPEFPAGRPTRQKARPKP